MGKANIANFAAVNSDPDKVDAQSLTVTPEARERAAARSKK
jgi:hypothetical protein